MLSKRARIIGFTKHFSGGEEGLSIESLKGVYAQLWQAIQFFRSSLRLFVDSQPLAKLLKKPLIAGFEVL